VAVSVLSGNRNFEGRINPDVKANYLASRPLVVAYALAGTADIDLTREPLGNDRTAARDARGGLAFTSEIASSRRPSAAHVPEDVRQRLRRQPRLERVPVAGGDLFEFKEDSTYIQDPPFFQVLRRPAAARGHPERGPSRCSATP
jgi:aconitate hydratase